MTHEEQAILEKFARGGLPEFLDKPLQVSVAYIGLPILGAFIGGLFGVCLELLLGSRLARNLSVVAGFILGLAWGLMDQRKYRRARRRYQQDLSDNMVEVLHCTADEAHRIESGTCPGEVGFFLDVGDSKVLFLQGEHLYDLEDRQLFPNRGFDIIRAPQSGAVLEVTCTGVPLTSTKTVKLAGRSRRALGDRDMCVFPGRLTSLESDLEKLQPASRMS